MLREPDCHNTEGFCCAGCAQKFWTRFQNLPAGLREIVYVRSFQALPNISVPSSTELGSNSPRTPVVPPVCYVNKSVLDESLPAILASSGKALVVHGESGMELLDKFLAHVPDQRAVKSIQELHLPLEYIFLPIFPFVTLNLPLANQGLRTLYLEMPAIYCLHSASEANKNTYTFKSAQELTTFLKLRQMFELPMLRSLKIQCCGGNLIAEEMGCRTEQVFANLISAASTEANKKSADFELMFEYLQGFDVNEFWGSCRWS
jgi:hypothetical protein